MAMFPRILKFFARPPRLNFFDEGRRPWGKGFSQGKDAGEFPVTDKDAMGHTTDAIAIIMVIDTEMVSEHLGQVLIDTVEVGRCCPPSASYHHQPG